MNIDKEYLSMIVSVVALFITYGLGRWSKTTDYKREKLEERYYNFYIPFFTELVRRRYPTRSYSQIVTIDNFKLLNLISKNLQYLDVESVGLFKDLYFYQIKVTEFVTGKYPENEKYFALLDETFDKIVKLSEKQSSRIARKLKLKQVTKNIL